MKRPLVVWAGGLSIGIILTEWIGPLAILAALLCLVLQHFLRQGWLVPFATACVLGCLLSVWHAPVWPGPFGNHQLQGSVASVSQTASGQSAIIQVKQWAGRQVPWWNPARLKVSYAEGKAQPGETISMQLTVRPLPEADNPGEFAYGNYLRRQGITAVATVDQISAQAADEDRTQIRELLLTKALSLGGQAGELLSTLLLGNTPGKWADAWRKTGTSHILAVSGLHVGLLFLLFERLLALCRLPSKARLILSGLLLLGYGLLLGFRPSVWRAIIMALVGLLAVLTGRMKDWPSAVALAALLLLALNPHLLFDPGFQLSFVATIGLFTIAPKLKTLLPVLPWQLDTAISASVAAQLATLPLVLYHFYLLSPFALVANLLLLPVLPVVMALGLTWLVLPFSSLLRPVFQLVFETILAVVDWLSGLPLASFSPGAPPVWLAIGYATLLGLLIAKPWPRLRRIVTGLWGISLVLLVTWQPLTRAVFSQHQLAVLSVGQGSASVLHLPGGEALLFDAGGGDESAGDWTIVPYLRWRGTWKIGAVYLSHLHEDHTIGLESVLDTFPVGKIVIAPSALGSEAYAGLLELSNRYGTPVELLLAGQVHRYDSLTITSVHQGADDSVSGENEASLVLQLAYPQFNVLLPGDIGTEEEMSILPYIKSPLHVLLVAHHGSAYSSSVGFLSSLRPEHGIISTGPNRYGHPAPAVLERLGLFAGSTWRTDEYGAIMINTNGRSYQVQPWRRTILQLSK